MALQHFYKGYQIIGGNKGGSRRGVIFFVVQRGDAELVSPAEMIDPEYGRLLRLAVGSGVEAIAYQAMVSPTEIKLLQRLPVIL